jgi:hypothetical protein
VSTPSWLEDSKLGESATFSTAFAAVEVPYNGTRQPFYTSGKFRKAARHCTEFSSFDTVHTLAL